MYVYIYILCICVCVCVCVRVRVCVCVLQGGDEDDDDEDLSNNDVVKFSKNLIKSTDGYDGLVSLSPALARSLYLFIHIYMPTTVRNNVCIYMYESVCVCVCNILYALMC